MAIELKVVDFINLKKAGASSKTVRFEGKVVNMAMASIKGFQLSYDDDSFKRKASLINPSTDIDEKDPSLVHVNLDYKFSDNNNNNMKGNIQILVLVDTELA